MEKIFDSISIGASVLDTFVMLDKSHRHRDTSSPTGLDECFPLGSKLAARQILQQSGGGATNSVTTFTRQRLNSMIISKIGNDIAGSVITDELKTEGINTKYLIQEAGGRTGQSVVLVEPDGVRTVLTDRATSGQLTINDLEVLDNTKSRWLYLSSLNGEVKVIEYIFEWAVRNGIKIAWNPGEAEIKLGKHIQEPWLAYTSLLMLNKEEASELLESSGGVDILAEGLSDRSIKRAVITDGKNTLSSLDCGVIRLYKPQDVKSVDATGAGDAFGSGVVCGLLKGNDLNQSIEFGLANSARVVMKIGAKTGIIYG